MSTAFKAKEDFREIIPSALHVDLTADHNLLKKMIIGLFIIY